MSRVRKVTKPKSTKTQKTVTLTIRTGDGKLLDVNPGLLNISGKLSKSFKESEEVYLENASEHSVNIVLEFYEVYNKFTVKQKKKWDDPILFVEKIGKAAQSDSDKRLVEHYNVYRKMPPKEFFELMKTAWDMDVVSLVKVLAFITTTRLIDRTTEDLEKMFASSKF